MSKASRILVIAVLLGVVCAGALFARNTGSIRLGLEFGDPQVALIIRPAPFDFKVGYNFTDNAWLFLSGDYRIISGYQLIDFLHMFLGVGLYGQVYFERSDPLDFGLRIPVGLQVFLLDNVLELFLEVAPTVNFIPALTAFDRWQGWIGFTLLVPRLR
jgi:hypothetical protein